MQTILIATFPVPPSINEQYSTDFETGRRVMTEVAKSWKEDVMDYLDAGNAPSPYAVHYLNTRAINDIRELYANTSRAKAILELKRNYRLETLVVFNSHRRDIDGGDKITQDVIFDWIAGKRDGDQGVNFNDRRVVQKEQRKLVDRNAFPHIEIVLKEIEITWESGQLINLAMREIEQQKLEPAFWKDATLKTPSIATQPLKQEWNYPAH